MDILTHTLSGIAAGTVIFTFSIRGFNEKLKVILFSGFGGALPDIDAISLWTGFDKTFGKLFGLTRTGKTIYFSKLWYSHHGFFHSIFAGLLFAFCMGLTFYFLQKNSGHRERQDIKESFKRDSLILTGFIAGFIMHLFEDMPTPACVWGGIRLLWPLKLYIGGTGDIWWWNNYDIFLIVLGVILVNGVVICSQRIIRIDIRKLVIFVFLLGATLCIFKIKTRGYDFNYVGQTSKCQQYEQKSKDIQRKILGDKTFRIIEGFDKKIRINF